MNTLSMNLSQDEKFILKTKFSSEQKNRRHMKRMMISMALFFFVFIIGFQFLLFGFRFSIFLVFQFAVVFLFVGMMPILMKKSGLSSDKFLYITNKKIYLEDTGNRIDSLSSIDLSLLKAFTFSKQKADRGENIGTIEFIPDYSASRRPSFLAKNIPNLPDFQKLIESIVFEINDIRSRWIAIKKDKNISLPHEFTISQGILNVISKKRKQSYVFILLMVPLIFVGFLLLPFALSQESRAGLRIFIYASVGPILFGVGFMLYFLNRIRRWSKGTARDGKLTLYRDKVEVSEGGSIKTLNFTDNTTLDFFKIFKGGKTQWHENVDGIIIKPSYDSIDVIKFGPLNNFTDFFEIVLCYILNWKADKGFLSSKDELSILKPLNTVENVSKPQRRNHLSLAPINRSNPSYKEYKNQLEPDEEIISKYAPPVKSLKYLIILIIGVILIVSYVILSFSGLRRLNFGLGLYSTFALVLSFFFICIGAQMLVKKNKLGDFMHVFTNKKIIVEKKFDYCLIPYENISLINKIEKKNGLFYTLELRLKRPVENNPYAVKRGKLKGLNEDAYFISKIPSNNNLIDIIQELIRENQ